VEKGQGGGFYRAEAMPGGVKAVGLGDRRVLYSTREWREESVGPAGGERERERGLGGIRERKPGSRVCLSLATKAGKASLVSLDLQRGPHPHPASPPVVRRSTQGRGIWGGGRHVSAYFPAGATASVFFFFFDKYASGSGWPHRTSSIRWLRAGQADALG